MHKQAQLVKQEPPPCLSLIPFLLPLPAWSLYNHPPAQLFDESNPPFITFTLPPPPLVITTGLWGVPGLPQSSFAPDFGVMNPSPFASWCGTPEFPPSVVASSEVSVDSSFASSVSPSSPESPCNSDYLFRSRRGRKPNSSKLDVCLDEHHSCTVKGCTDSFRSRFSLKRHLKWHTGQRPYRCHWRPDFSSERCGAEFAEKSTLRRHIQTHVRAKPYVCGVPGCNKAFADRVNCARHKQKHLVESAPYDGGGEPPAIGQPTSGTAPVTSLVEPARDEPTHSTSVLSESSLLEPSAASSV